MFQEQYAKIKHAVNLWEQCGSEIEFCRRQLNVLDSHDETITLGFMGNSGSVSIPAAMQDDLRKFLHDRFGSHISELAATQKRIVCPHSTND